MADIQTEAEKKWYGLLGTVMNLPGVKVNRRDFLSKELQYYCDQKQIEQALECGTAKADIQLDVLDKLAKGVIKFHSGLAIGGSFIAGLPGGLALLGTVPADLAQFYYHALQIAQKLAYIYGWQDVDEATDEFLAEMTILIGVMYGISQAHAALKILSEILAKEAAKRIPRIALTKTAIYPIVKKIASWLGIKMTKPLFGQTVAKIIPVVGGGVNAIISAVTIIPMANRLKSSLREGYSILSQKQ
jgi:hypothetical protein